MTVTRCLGVDPGLKGAVALWDSEMDFLVVQDMPSVKTGKNSVISEGLLADMIRRLDPQQAWVELVHAMPKQGVVSTFNFGLGFGLVRGVITALGVPLHLVHSRVWKGAYGLRRDKRDSRVIAARLFPSFAREFSRVKDDGKAEAALIALYGAERQG